MPVHWVGHATKLGTDTALLMRRCTFGWSDQCGPRRLCDLGHLQTLKKRANLLGGGAMKSNRPAVFLALFVLTSSAASQPATISWPEAVAQLPANAPRRKPASRS